MAKKPDLYPSMTALLSQRRAEIDYRVTCTCRGSDVTILAPHGGKIEPQTSEIASEIAGLEFNLFCFDGILKHENNFDVLHVTANHYDHPDCLKLVRSSAIVVAMHGLRSGDFVDVGGLDEELQASVVARLQASSFRARIDRDSSHSGRSPENICNRGIRGKGVQLEIPQELRDALHGDGAKRAAFANAIRAAIRHA